MAMDGKQQEKTIIAMKGLPYTGKTSMAKVLAFWLDAPVFTLDDMLDTLSSQQRSDHIQDLAFEMICRIARSQLEKVKQMKCVIIDSPLSSRSQLGCLIRWAKSMVVGAASVKVKVLIVDCQRRDKYAWETSFEQMEDSDKDDRRRYWYKVQSWNEIKKSVKGYDASLDRDYGDISGISISKLVIDPPFDVDYSYVDSPKQSAKPLLVQAVNDLMMNRVEIRDDDDHDVLLMDLMDWRTSHRPHRSSKKPCKFSHFFTQYIMPDDHQGESFCLACQGQITPGGGDALYTCKVCSLVLHKQCAELPEKDNFKTLKMYWSDFHQQYQLIFPGFVDHTCDSCKTKGKSFSSGCPSCVFLTHLRCQFCPTIIKHHGHQHILSILLDTADISLNNICVACGGTIRNAHYLCMICDFHYHSKCLFLPYEVTKEHHGYRDPMKLKFSPEEELEDYLCNACEQKRNPMHWYYYCEECDYATHLKCNPENPFDLSYGIEELDSDDSVGDSLRGWLEDGDGDLSNGD